MEALITFWSHGLAASVFAGLLLWRFGIGLGQPGHRLLLAAFAMTGCWAWLYAIEPDSALASYAETARDFIWVTLLYSLSTSEEVRQQGLRMVYAAVAAVLGMQVVADAAIIATGSQAVTETAHLLRMTAAAGGLVLVHNLYGQASPASRSNIRFAMIGLALMWAYDLNLYTFAYLDAPAARPLFDWRGVAVALAGPFFALGAAREDVWRVRLSRAATFQSLSLLAICGYFTVMTLLATALRGSGWDWSSAILIGVLAVMTVGAMVVLPSARARGWAKVKLAKHLFEHRYDYRTEWLRFTDTLGRSGSKSLPLSERIIKAFADILEAPGGVLIEREPSGALVTAASWNWPSADVPAGNGPDGGLWDAAEQSGRIIELDAVRGGWGDPKDRKLPLPAWLRDDPDSWVGVPLIHHERLSGIVLLAAPDYRRPLDWEDFDLLRTAGRQAASSLAEAHGQSALANAQRFEEFNRRFAFILHDIKNLVSQLSLLSRNAERHADNAEFRADMVATLKGSVGKMNDLLARLSPATDPRPRRVEPQPLRAVLSSAIASRRGLHEMRLLGDSSVWAVVDPVALEQAVGHLLQNAIEASPLDEPVLVRIASDEADVVITIADKGAGMDSEFLRNRLFQPFVSTKPDGFGIGAFEARSLITAMGGRITVDSRRGRGTTFTIRLPAAEAAPAKQRKRA